MLTNDYTKVNLRILKESEYNLVRDLRLAALRDAPNSFAESTEETLEKPESYWIDLTRSLTNQHIMFIADISSEPCGFVYGIRDKERTETGRVGGMWVSSKNRGQGIGQSLLLKTVEWAVSEGFKEIRLWVPIGSIGAKSLYSKAGFVETGENKSVSDKHSFKIEEMVLDLSKQSFGA